MDSTKKPTIGDGATYTIGADSYPYTVIEVSPSGKTIRVQRDRAVLVGGEGEDSRHVYIPNTDREAETFTLRRSSGSYHRKGHPATYGALEVGHRKTYRAREV